jgi:hypothetical protein
MKESYDEACERVIAESASGVYSEFGYSSEDVAALAELRDNYLRARTSELYAAEQAFGLRFALDQALGMAYTRIYTRMRSRK